MRTKEALTYAIELGVDYLGFVIDYPKSPRSITLNEFLKTAAWLKENKKGKYKIVAVTVDMPAKKLQAIIYSRLADVIQLHGNEPTELVKKLKGTEIWKAWNHKSKGGIMEMAKHAGKILLDSGSAAEKANNKSGEFDAYTLYKKLRAKRIDIVLSGGIDAKNIEGYLEKLKPGIIDISRGIETMPGKKSKAKMKKIMSVINDYYNS